MVEITHRSHSVGQSAYHLVWRPKYNHTVFKHAYPRKVVTDSLIEAAKKWNIQIFEMEVMSNHVHLFVNIPPTMNVSFCMQILKGYSSRAFFKRCVVWKRIYSKRGQTEPHLWSPGKFFRSVGSVTAEAVQKYIKNSNNWSFEYIDGFQKRLSGFK